jgi:hypothetical protein
MMMSARWAFVLLMAATCSASGWAQQNAAAKPAILVELFTSEGCSSCPPADDLLKQMEGKAAPSGQTVVALSEHVTYWNHDGWADPFSQEIFTERQEAYRGRFGLSDVYTPQMVVNGDRQMLGSDGRAIVNAFAMEPKPAAELKIVSVTAEGNAFNVRFTLGGILPKSGADVFVAVAQNEATSAVLKGENKGRTLTHVSVVRSLIRVATLKSGATLTVKVPRGNAPQGSAEHLVLFAQAKGQGKVLNVATATL